MHRPPYINYSLKYTHLKRGTLPTPTVSAEWERNGEGGKTVQLNQPQEMKTNNTHFTQHKEKKQRTYSYQCYTLDRVLFGNNKISNHDGHFHGATLCHEILLLFTLHKKQSTCWRKFFPKVFQMNRQSDVGTEPLRMDKSSTTRLKM